MTAPQFAVSAGDPRLYWLDGANWSPNGGFGLVLYPSSTGAPSTLGLADSFSRYPGYYLSVAQRPASDGETAFADAVLATGTQLGPARFFWLAGSTPTPDWLTSVVYLDQATGAGQGRVQRPTVFGFGRYRFSVSAGQLVSPGSTGFVFDASGLAGLPGFQLLTDDKAWPLTAAGEAISLAGAAAGTFAATFDLDATANPGGISDYTVLDVGFRYGLADPDDPAGVLLRSLRYPLFGELPASPVAMAMGFDPAGVLDPSRTALHYPATPAVLTSCYTSQLGYPVTLCPDTSDPDDPPGLGFHRSPRTKAGLASDDPLYLAPFGPYTLGVGAPTGGEATPAARLTGGVSGSEFFGFSTGTEVPLRFSGSQPAYAPNFPPASPDGATVVDELAPALTSTATTAYASVGPPTGGQAWYFAQPEGGAFFHIRTAEQSDDPGDPDLVPYLELLELIAGSVTTGGTAYPLVPYAGVAGDDLSVMQALESQVLSPLRRAALGVPPTGRLRVADPGSQDVPTQAVNPQGLLATFTGNTWSSLVLCPPVPGTVLPQLAFNGPSTTFRAALQSNQLFLVAANPTVLAANADFNYWVTDAVLGDLARLSGAEAVPSTVIDLLGTQARTPQTSLEAFTAMVDQVLVGPNAAYRDTVIKYSMYFELAVEGWRFRMSPTLWADQRNPPILIFKYADGSLYDFVQNTEAWAWPEVATLGGSITATQALLNGIMDGAVAEVDSRGTDSNLYGFVTDVVTDPSWRGVLMLNASVPFSSVPPELAGLAAGIDITEFRAHHVGISVTPVAIDETARTLSQDHSTIFGLIDYQQPEDIAHIDGDFDFKVLLLQVLFANSAIANFAGQIELFINRLFAELVTLFDSVHYNNLILNGTYQHQGGTGHYVFATTAASVYGSDAAGRGGSTNRVVLLQTEIDQAQFVTSTRDSVTDPLIRNRFLLQGRLRFAGLLGFDAFSFGPTLDDAGVQVADGYLAFGAVSVDMDMPVNDPTVRTFRFNLDEISFDPAASQARPSSFFQRFPLQIAGLVQGDATALPRDLGYLPVATPLTQPGFTGAWFGLVFAVDLGTLGALSSAPALAASVICAWCPTGTQHAANIGLKLPGVQSARALLPVEGVLDLGFSSIDLTADGATASPPDPAYVLRFLNFYLRFLGWKFPPGQNTIALFGNPDTASMSLAADRGALGWYAAYQKKAE